MTDDREKTPLELALDDAAADPARAEDFYDVLLESDLVVPTRPDGEAPGEAESADLLVLIDEKDIQHMPVFASDAAMDSWEAADKMGRKTIPAAELISAIIPTMRMVLNPGLDVAKVFDGEELKELRRLLRQKGRRKRKEDRTKTHVAFTAVTAVSEEFHDALANNLAARRTLKAIYLLDVEDRTRPSGSYMLVLVDIRPSDFEPAAKRTVDLFTELFPAGTPVEIACLPDERMWADIVKDHGVQAIYPKKD